MLRLSATFFVSTFGERLRQYAKARFGSLKKLSEASGVEYTQLSKYAGDDQKPRVDVVEKIVGPGVNAHWLLTGSGEMDAPPNDDSLLRPAEERLAALLEQISKSVAEAQRLREEMAREDSPGPRQRSGRS